MTCHAFRFHKGLYGYKAALRLQVDAENHQKFFFEDNPERATLMRSRSVEVKSLKRSRMESRQFLASKLGRSTRRATVK